MNPANQKLMKKNLCPDCGVEPGALHVMGCDIARCPECGMQHLSCDCNKNEQSPLPWTGEWPGVAECKELGFMCVYKDKWVPCDVNTPGAIEDLNRLYTEATWNKAAQKWERK